MRNNLTRCFRDAMTFLDPEGLSPANMPHQLTDLVRVFVTGWGEAMNFYDTSSAASEAFFAAVKDIADPAFSPGPEWKWW